MLAAAQAPQSARSTALDLTSAALTDCVLAQALTALSVVLAVAWATHRYAPAAARKVYLLDTFTYKPPDRCALCFGAHTHTHQRHSLRSETLQTLCGKEGQAQGKYGWPSLPRTVLHSRHGVQQ